MVDGQRASATMWGVAAKGTGTSLASLPTERGRMTTLADPDTPFAVVDRARVRRNAQRLTEHLSRLGVPLRLHVKTVKSLEFADFVLGGTGPIAVSTLAEAEAFADGGYTDIMYAVGIAPAKLPRVVEVLRRGVTLSVLLDSAPQARAVAEASRAAGRPIPALIEIDCDGHRSGLHPDDPAVAKLARFLADAGGPRGLLTHAGESYYADSPRALSDAAANERDRIVHAAARMRAAGFACPVVSVGSTPTAHAASDLKGITDVRAGNFVFFDLVMAGIGVCTLDDVALSVVVTVIGHQPDKRWIITDGGWMATSRDRAEDAHGYGLVTDLAGELLPDLVMSQANQEHGILTMLAHSDRPLPELPIGTRLRILPHHACATASQHREYHVGDGGTSIEAVWPRVNGW